MNKLTPAEITADKILWQSQCIRELEAELAQCREELAALKKLEAAHRREESRKLVAAEAREQDIRMVLLRVLAIMDNAGRANAEDNGRMLWDADWSWIRERLISCVNEMRSRDHAALDECQEELVACEERCGAEQDFMAEHCQDLEERLVAAEDEIAMWEKRGRKGVILLSKQFDAALEQARAETQERCLQAILNVASEFGVALDLELALREAIGGGDDD